MWISKFVPLQASNWIFWEKDARNYESGMFGSCNFDVGCTCTFLLMTHTPAVPQHRTGRPNSAGRPVTKLVCIPIKIYDTFAELL